MKRLGVALLVLGAAAVPAFAGDFQLFRLTTVLVTAVALLGLNILAGYNGQISLGHGAFFTLGAYIVALLPYWLALPAAGAVCFVAGCAVALPVARLRPMHFALITFALAAVTPTLANHPAIAPWTGGSQGLALDKPVVPFGLPLSYDQWLYLLTLGVLLLGFVLASNLLGGRIGRAAIAVRDHELAALASGIDAVGFKTLIFGVSASYAGVAGALSALALQYVSPAGVLVSLGFLIGSAVGGIATLSGAIYGALFLQGILFVTGAIAQTVKTTAVFAVYGVVVIAFLHLLPGGVAGAVAELARRLRRRPA